MSDQLSKVVAEMRASSDAVDWKLKECADQIEAAMKKGCEGESMSKEAKRGWNKAWPIESATTPAEVDAPGIDTANHAGVRVRGYTVEQYATLARQLAEAKAENAIATSVHEHERLNLMSQLAEATRRVAEVEGLVGKWRHNAQGCGRKDAHAAGTWRSCARELEAALQKEPK